MKVLHLTNELSQKNFSISSLILFYLRSNKNKKNNLKIIASNISNDFLELDKKNIKTFKSKIIMPTSILFNLFENLKTYDFIHIHGIWAPIQLLSILYCALTRTKFAIHPHGMLLDQAIRSGGKHKYYLKKITLLFLRLFIRRSNNFISITNEESQLIKKYFPLSKVFLVPNPMPFDLSSNNIIKLKKNFVYFGRIHPIKNLAFIIKSFIDANLGNEWCLYIYGIKDDVEYYQYLKKISKNHSNIKIKEPVFGNEKQKLMKTSWCNILLSKSEVLSLSLLESSAHSLPTLSSDKLDLADYDKFSFKTKMSLKNASRKIIEITKLEAAERVKIGRKVRENFLKNQKKINYSSVFNKIYSHIYLKDKDSSYFEYGALSLSYIFNFFISSILVALFVLNKNYEAAGDLGLVASFFITITQILSGNRRSLILSDPKNSNYVINKTLIERSLFAVFLLIISFYLYERYFYIYFDLDRTFILTISSLIVIQWINEIVLVKRELQYSNSYFFFLSFINILYLISCFFTIYFFEINFIFISNIIYIFILLIPIVKELLYSFVYYDGLKLKNFLVKYDLSYFSSFSIVISGFFWRLIVFNIFDKSLTGILYACFSIASFPGTLFNNVIGPTYVRNKLSLTNNLKMIFGLVFLLLSVIIFKIKFVNNVIGNFDYFIYIASISLIGSYFMVYSLFIRQKLIINREIEANKVFLIDIINGLSITGILPLLNYLGGFSWVIFSYLVASIISLTFYFLLSYKK